MADSKAQEGSGKCTLCEGEARMFCESDEAMLCWDCDTRVHGANFLVARHMRTLLCQSCRAPTTWKASGARLAPTISLCSNCCFRGGDTHTPHVASEADEAQIEEVEEEEEGENQVVPWGLMPVSGMVTPPGASWSSSNGSTLKRPRNEPADQPSPLPKVG